MSFALAGLRIPGVRIANPKCVEKTYPRVLQRSGRAGRISRVDDRCGRVSSFGETRLRGGYFGDRTGTTSVAAANEAGRADPRGCGRL